MLFSTILIAAGIIASVPDTLQSAVVVADKGLVVSKTDTLECIPGKTLMESIRDVPTLYLGDYGGAAGQKNINLRGLGSAHTVIYMDGVKVGNVQSGQSDLTNLGLEQYGSAVIDYAQNSVSFSTAKPSFMEGRKISGEAALSGGSFGTWRPFARLNFKFGHSTTLSANASGIISNGKYKFGDGLIRENNDMRAIGCGLDAFGTLDAGRWHAKIHYNGSGRGIPGSVSWPSSDRQADRNAYLQGFLEERFSGIYTLAASAKYAFDRMDYLSSWGDSRYDQNEVQLNSSHRFKVNSWIEVSLAADFTWDKLQSTYYNSERYSPVAVLGAAFRTERLRADVAMEYNGAFDRGGLSRHTLSPSADIRLQVLQCLELSAFARRACRVPTFNELYYTGYGNPDLKPEDAFLSGAGLSFRRHFGTWVISSSADGFLNLLNDKIVSAPTAENPSIWLPYNIGKVRSTGADIIAGFSYEKNSWTACFKARYCYQSAVDRTPGSSSYGEQIAYVSRHTVCLDGHASFRGWRLGATWNLRSGIRDGNGATSDWNTLDATLSKDLKIKGCGPLTLFISGKNLLNCRYEAVRDYPMPGVSVCGGFNFSF